MNAIKAIIIISSIAIAIAARRAYKEIKEDEEKLKRWNEERLQKYGVKNREKETKELEE